MQLDRLMPSVLAQCKRSGPEVTRSATRFLLPEYGIILRVNVKEAVCVFCENVHINKTVRITSTLAKGPRTSPIYKDSQILFHF